MQKTVIVGGGLAGAAVACFLSHSGQHAITVLEQETLCGVHASGRNAAMIRQIVPSESLAALCREGARYVREQPDFPVDFQRHGSLFLASDDGWQSLRRSAERATLLGVDCVIWSREQCIERVPVLAEAAFEGAVYTASDGVVDVAGLLQGFHASARSRGVELRTAAKVTGIVRKNGRVRAVLTDDGELPADQVVDAAGPWASDLASMAGLARPELRPLRRHLYVSELDLTVDPSWPYVWNLSAGYYFRPESGGLLLCCCDEDLSPPCTPETDPEVAERLAECFARWVPALAGHAIRHSWAGLRTFGGDRGFVLGPDPRLEGFVWAAALGGHGVTCSPAVGRLVAGGFDKPELCAGFSVERLLL